jgi:hypothetical protein
LQALGPHITLRPFQELTALAADAGLVLADRRKLRLATGKTLVSALFDKARRSMGRTRGKARC